jgi:hypothetical protein
MDLFLDAVGDTVSKLFDEDGRKKRPAVRMTQKSRNRGHGGSGTDRQRSSSRGQGKTNRNGTVSDRKSSESATVSSNTSITETLMTRTTATSFAGKTAGTSVAQSTVGSVEGLWLKHQRSTSVTRTQNPHHRGGSAGDHALLSVTGNAAALRHQSRGNGNSSRGGNSSDKSDPRRLIDKYESTINRRGRSESPRRPIETRGDKSIPAGRREIHEKSADYNTYQPTSSKGRREVAPPRKEFRSFTTPRKEFRSYTTPQPNNNNPLPLSTSVVPPYRNRQVQWPSSVPTSSQNQTLLPKPQVPVPLQHSWATTTAPVAAPPTHHTANASAYGHHPSPRSTNSASTYGPQMMVESGTEQQQMPPSARSTSRTHSNGGGVRAGNSTLQPYGHGHAVQNARQVLMANRQLSRLSEAEVETDRDDSICIREEHEDQVNVLLARALAAEKKSRLYLQELQELRTALKEWEQHGADEWINPAQRRQVLLPIHQAARSYPIIIPIDDTVQSDREFESAHESRCLPSCVDPLPNWLKSCGCLARPDISQPATRAYRMSPTNENGSRTSCDDRDLCLPNGTTRNNYAQAMMMHPDHLMMHPDHIMMPQLDPTHASRMRLEDMYQAARSNDFGGMVHEHSHSQHKHPGLRNHNSSPRSKSGSGTGSKSNRSEQYYGEHQSMLMSASAAQHQHVRAGASHQYHPQQQRQPPPPPAPLPHNLEGRTIVIYPGPTPDQLETGTAGSSSVYDHSNPYYVM